MKMEALGLGIWVSGVQGFKGGSRARGLRLRVWSLQVASRFGVV